jgi:hypothetical protein
MTLVKGRGGARTNRLNPASTNARPLRARSCQPSARAALSSASAQDETASLPAMIQPRLNAYDELIVGPMIALARSSIRDRIVMAGTNSAELMLERHRRGYVQVATTANCHFANGQCDVALVDWRRKSIEGLKATLDWLMDLLNPAGVMVVWVDPMQPSQDREIRSALGKRGLIVAESHVDAER